MNKEFYFLTIKEEACSLKRKKINLRSLKNWNNLKFVAYIISYFSVSLIEENLHKLGWFSSILVFLSIMYILLTVFANVLISLSQKTEDGSLS